MPAEAVAKRATVDWERRDNVVRVVDVVKDFMMGATKLQALKGVSLAIKVGQYVSIMGPSGSGKSTLFNIIGGLDKPTGGKVYIDEVDIAQLDAYELAWLRCRKIGYIFQTFNLIPVMTALENVSLPMIFAGSNRDEAVERSLEILDRVGIKDRALHKPAELSGGQQQRVAIARAFANNPSVILADEPTGNLDLKTGQDIITLLKQMNRDQGVTVITATHDFKMLDVSDRIVWVRDGRIDKDERREEITIHLGGLNEDEAQAIPTASAVPSTPALEKKAEKFVAPPPKTEEKPKPAATPAPAPTPVAQPIEGFMEMPLDGPPEDARTIVAPAFRPDLLKSRKGGAAQKMKLTFYGATRTVTGSKYLIEANGKRILLECGMYQGRRQEWIDRNTTLPFPAADVDLMLLSHAHIDHSGIIPVLTKNGFRGPIYCTDATADLCKVMLMDSAHIQEQDAEFVSKKHAKKGLPPAQPLYTQIDAEKSFGQLNYVSYNRPTVIADGITATFLDAGHMLGSAMIILDIEEIGRKIRFVFSGDLGRGNSDILRDPEIPSDADFVMMECTYGNREHEDLANVTDHLCDIVNHAADAGGKIIMPSFAVGRTQQLLYALNTLAKQKRIPELPIIVDSPLAFKSTEVFKNHPGCFNKRFQDAIRQPDNPLKTKNLTFTTSVEESIALNDRKGPCIIISASGMAEAGRVRHHIKNNIGEARNTILIPGWCAPNTLGAFLKEGKPEVNIFGEPYKVKAKIETMDAFSGHADKSELRNWLEQVTGNLRGIFLVHGEEEPGITFANIARELHAKANVLVPNFQDDVEL